MMTQVHLNLPYLTIHWDEEGQLVWMEWKAVVMGEDLPTGLQRGLEFLNQKGAQRWLLDFRILNALSVGDPAWSYEEWAHRATGAGLRSLAILFPIMPVRMGDALSFGVLVHHAAKARIEVDVSESIQKARAWLAQPLSDAPTQEPRIGGQLKAE